MNAQTELFGKIQISYIPTNRGVNICEIERIDKFTELRESKEGRFALKIQIEDNLNDAIDFVFRQKLYISKAEATEIVHEFLT